MAIKFVTPTPETPGFLRRVKRAMYLSEKLNAGSMTASVVDELVEFLADYVMDMEREQAKEALLDASQEQFTKMLQAVAGVQSDAVPLAKKPRSKSGTS